MMERLFLGGENADLAIALATDNNTIVNRNQSYSWSERNNFDIESMFDEDDHLSCFSIEYLIDALKTLQAEVSTDDVKVRLSTDKPISFLAKDNDSKMIASVAPYRENSWKRGSLEPIEANLLGYHVICEEDSCEWKGDRFKLQERAVEAANDHRYFTGHEFKIKDYNGEEVELE
jgi:hypothetical protein